MSVSLIGTILYVVGMGFLVVFLSLQLYRSRLRTKPAVEIAGSRLEESGPVLTSRRIKRLRVVCAVLLATAFGFHSYWALFAAGPLAQNDDFALLKNRRDQRNRRGLESNLRGWIFDRHGDVRRTFAKYRYLNGQVIRDYPLGAGSAHLIGYTGLVRGDSMIERAVAVQSVETQDRQRSFWRPLFSREDEARKVIGPDLLLTVDFELQRDVAAALQGKSGAIVMINPQTGDLLALASAPAFEPDDVNDDEKWSQISRDIRNRPLVNRALNEYYLPGSTLKLITASAALEARLEKQTHRCRSEGWVPPASGRPIRDDEGESHGQIGLFEAMTHSCNQYFSQLGVDVGQVKLGEAAGRFGLRVFASSSDSLGAGSFRKLWNTENLVLSDVLAPIFSTYVAGRRTSAYDLALQSIGQGYVQLTPMQMAMVVGAVANEGGNVMRPKVEMERAPMVLSQAMTPDTAAQLRSMLGAVVARGTASGAFAGTRSTFTAGGKTGTAQWLMTVIDPKTDQPVMIRDEKGVARVKKAFRIDSWFVGFAPLEHPQVAIAVIIEGGGYGGRTAAPIAASLLARSQSLGLMNPPVTETTRKVKN